MSIKILLFVFFIVCFESTYGKGTIWKGRHKYGNLGEPNRASHKLTLPPDEWYTQKLDHFDPTNNKTWQQRYQVNNSFYKPGGPVFLMIGGEGEISANWMVQGAWIGYAKEHGALCYQLEHRYYGKSHPTEDLSTKNLIYLSSEQALADLATFIESMNIKMKLNETTKWIAFGGSYPGSLAAWVREKYPFLIHGSISTSGPLLAKANFYEYFYVVEDSLRTYSDECVAAVRQGIAQIETLMKHMIGQRSLNEKFKLCDPIEKTINDVYNIANLYESIAGNFAGVVQYNKDNSPHSKITIDQVCDLMTNTTIGPQVTRLGAVNSLILASEKEPCLDYKYDKMIIEVRNVSWDSEAASGNRQWTYQTCTEFGFYQTSDDERFLFREYFPLDFFIKQCVDIYGTRFGADELQNAIQRTNNFYGALNPATTNVLYVHGSIDPWHALGLIEMVDPKMPVIYINGTAHCANMYEPNDETDLPQLKSARVKINEFIKQLLL